MIQQIQCSISTAFTMIEKICIKMKTFLQMVTKNTDKLTTHQILMNKSNVESNKLKLNLK